MRLQNRIRICACMIAIGLSAPFFAGPSFAQEAFKVTTTGGSARGFIKVSVEALHAIIRDANPGASATFRPSSVAGGLASAAAGTADIAIGVPPVELKRGINGNPPFKAPLKGKVKALMELLDKLHFFWIADASWAKENGIKSFRDISEKKPKMRINLTERGTFYAVAVAEALFKEHGFSLTDIEKWGGEVVYSASGSQIKNLQDGKVDLILSATFNPDGRIVNLSKTKDLAWISADREVLSRVAKSLNMRVANTPKSSYSFLASDEPSIEAALTTVAGSHVSDKVAYEFVKTIAGDVKRVRAIHPAFKDFSVSKMARKPDMIEWHPGALKYYKEAGIIE